MFQEIRIGKIAGLQVSITPSVIISSLLLWIVLASAAVLWLRANLTQALLVGFIAVVLHWASDLIHHLGHAQAARRTGYPMLGVRFWLLLGTSIYPSDEPKLPAAVHIRRAWGGPIASLCTTLLGLVFIVMSRQSFGLVFGLALFFFLDNLFVFSLGAMTPMGFTDGSTLLAWRSRR